MRLNYFIIPLATIMVALSGGRLTSGGMDWYRTLKLPSWTPSGSVIGIVWTAIFVLTAISALIVWNRTPAAWARMWFAAILIVNAILNVLWSLLFFRLHWMGIAAIGAALLDLTIFGLIFFAWPVSRFAVILLIPYAGWVAFATYLTATVWRLNT